MEIDTGAAVSIISDTTHTGLSHLLKLPLQPTKVKLQTYTGESISVLGELAINVTCQGISCILPLLVVKQDGSSLIQLDWKSIFTINTKVSLKASLEQ